MLILLVVITCQSANGQDRIRQAPCFDSAVHHQADSLKLNLAKDGFILLKEASMTMESEYEMPVIVPLTQGSWYQFVFIGAMDGKLYEVRMYDYNERQVIYQKHYGQGMESNVISYSYIPKQSEYHVIKPVQVALKKHSKNLCGYIMMFKKVK